MKTAAQIRRERLLALQAELRLSVAEMNGRLGRSRRDSTLYQIINATPDSATGRPRAMGDDQARALESEFGKPVGWMDRDPDYDALLAQHAAEPSAVYRAWPFPEIDPERWQRLPPDEQARVQQLVLTMIDLIERAQPHAGGNTHLFHEKPRRAA